MADELNTNAEFNGRHKDEEDPILVAQRYLNIYRQLHIFNDRRRKEYDDDVIKLPSNIKMLLSTIPGGGLLLEHIKEVEEARGISSDVTPQVTFLDQEDIPENTTKGKGKNSSKKDSGGVVSADLIKILRQNEEQHSREMQALTEAFTKSQESMATLLKEILSKPAMVVPAAEPVIQPKPEPVQEEPAQTEISESQKTLDEILPEPDQPQEDQTPSKEEKEGTSSIFGSLAKRLFSSHKAEQNTPNIAKPDNTPVSLEDISDAPVSLDENNLAEDSQISALLNDVNPDTDSDDSDWEWDYVDDTLLQSPQADSELPKEDGAIKPKESSQDTENDEEWEYIEEPQETTPAEKDQNSEDEDKEEWEYVEAPQDTENDEEWEYVEAPEDAETPEEWEYVEAPEDTENTEEWEYVEAPEGIENTEEWEYVEEPQETAQDLSQPLKDTKE